MIRFLVSSLSLLQVLNLRVLLSALIAAAGIQLAAQGPLVAAASDLAPILSSYPDARFTFGSSGQLARQIENGAPYELFLSANRAYAEQLIVAGKAKAEDLRPYATGRLAIWSKSGRYKRLEDLLDPAVRHIAIANPSHAPYGQAARQALEKAGLWNRLQPKLVYAESVRQTLQFAESGNADVTLTAWSLVHGRSGVLVPGDLYAPLTQFGVPVAGSEVGRRLLNWLLGPKGQKMLQDGGLFPPP